MHTPSVEPNSGYNNSGYESKPNSGYIAILNQLQINLVSLIVIKLVLIQAFLQNSPTYLTKGKSKI
jgi:hypothetical protein